MFCLIIGGGGVRESHKQPPPLFPAVSSQRGRLQSLLRWPGSRPLALTAASRASTAFPGQLHTCRLGDTPRALSELEGTRPGGLPPGAEKKRRDEEAMLCRAEVSGGKGGRAGGARKGGEVAPCDLPAAIRLEPHELGLNPA